MRLRTSALAALVAAVLILPAAPAFSASSSRPARHHHEGGDGDDRGNGYSAGHDCRDGGGCNNRRREDYSGAGCKYVCPKFDKSPVEDSFNPTVCVMPGSCAPQGDRKRGGGDEEPAPAPGPGERPSSLFPPTPAGIRDFVVNTTKAGLGLGQLFADATITFVTNLMVGLA